MVPSKPRIRPEKYRVPAHVTDLELDQSDIASWNICIGIAERIGGENNEGYSSHADEAKKGDAPASQAHEPGTLGQGSPFRSSFIERSRVGCAPRGASELAADRRHHADGRSGSGLPPTEPPAPCPDQRARALALVQTNGALPDG
jgi:hypothetical protein